MKPNVKYTPGSTHETKWGPVEILDRTSMKVVNGKRRKARCVLRVLATGSVLDVQEDNLREGKFTDPRMPTVYGVGYLDTLMKIPKRGKGSDLRRAYDMWTNMLKRAYHSSQSRYYSDVTVDVRWHSFKNFWNSLPEVPGYEDWLVGRADSLDKDIRVPGNRVYSRDTCMLVSRGENSRDVCNRRWGGVRSHLNIKA